jgi:hypothetical protein
MEVIPTLAILIAAMLSIASLSCLRAHAQQCYPLAANENSAALAVTTPVDASGDAASPVVSASPIPSSPAVAGVPIGSGALGADALPDAPQPQGEMAFVTTTKTDDSKTDDADAPQHGQKQTTPGYPPVSPTPRPLPRSPQQHPGIPSEPPSCLSNVCRVHPEAITCSPRVDYFQRFVDSGIHPLTAREKGYLAMRNTVDPYNFATIAFLSGVSVASDPHSAYGPGFPGFARNFGVAYTETAIGEFFGTFLIPAVTHEDPHYHRLPNASYGRRLVHAATQVVWAQSDYGVPMANYSTLITTAVSIGLGNLYVPGRDKSWGTAANRYVTAIYTAPIGNLISEFLPDVARRVNVRIVVVQRIIDRVQRENGG